MKAAKRPTVVVAATLCGLASAASAEPMGTAFTYQGQLKQGGAPVSNTACEFAFSLWNAALGGGQIATHPPVTVPADEMVNGLFTVILDFGAGAFDGDARWLEIGVSCPPGGTSVPLGRQELTPGPYAIFASAGGGGGPAFWADNGNDIYNTNAGNVGIGNPTPSSALTVGDGVTEAGIEVGNGALCVDSDGACSPGVAGGLKVGVGGITGTNVANGNVLLAPGGTGNVGIGTDDPQGRLHVKGASWTQVSIEATTNDPFLQLTSDGSSTNNDWTMRMDASGSDRLEFRYDNSPKLRMNTSGGLTVGDGVSQAGISIDNGGVCIDSDGSCAPPGAGGLRIGSTGIVGADSSDRHVLLVPDASGNVGVGTPDPDDRLTVAGATRFGADNFSPGNIEGFRIFVDNTSSVCGNDCVIFEKSDASVSQANPDSGMAFVTVANDGVVKPRMTITGNGRVGIRTADPAAPLHIADGDVVVDDYGSPGSVRGRRANGSIEAPTAVTTDDPLAQFVASGHDGTGFFTEGWLEINASEPWTPTGHGTYMRFLTTGSGALGTFERMRIAGDGKVGIGVTAPETKLHVRGNAIFLDDYGSPDSFVGRRANGRQATPTALLQGQAITSIAARGYGATGFSGDRAKIEFRAAENWTDTAQGTTIRFRTTKAGTDTQQERMRVADDGNVGIGTTEPGNNRLRIKGNSSALGLEGTDHVYIEFFPDGVAEGRKGFLGYRSANNNNITVENEIPDGDIVLATTDTGNVGIGRDDPIYRLDVRSSGSRTINAEATGTLSTGVFGWHTAGSGAGWGVVGRSSSPQGVGILGQGTGGGWAGVFQGDVFVDGTTTTQILEITGADLAEKFPVTEKAKPGTVMAIDADNPGQLCLARGAYNRRVAGVVSGANGLSVGAVLGNLPGNEDAPPIALSGRVWVHCDAGEEPIEPGDLLTTSDTPGHAMKVTNHTRAQGAILGKAMTSLDEGTGLVLVLVTLQ